MKQKTEKNFIVDVLFVLTLFGVFAFSALVLVAIGADVYQHTVRNMSRNSDARITISYLAGKLRQYDTTAGEETAFFVEDLEGTPALVLSQEINGETYYTYLYCHEGALRELMMRKGSSLGGSSLGAGQKIMDLQEFRVEQASDNLLSVQITASDGRPRQLFLSSHCTAPQ